MRRLSALAIAVVLTWLIVVRAVPGNASSTALALGVTLIGAAIVGWLCEFIRLPRITGYLVVGLVCGPSIANVVTDPVARDLQSASGFAVVVIAFIAGLRLNVVRIRPEMRRVLRFTVLAAAVGWCAVAAGVIAAWSWLPFADVADGPARFVVAATVATLLISASPATVIAVIAESRARGPLADLATEVAVVLEIAAIALFTICLSAARVSFGAPASGFAALAATGLWSVFGSIAFGAMAGGAFAIYLRLVGREVTVVFIALCALLTGVAGPLTFQPFLTGLAAGAVVQNVFPATGDVLGDAIEYGAMPALVLFFVALGASMHVDAMAGIGVVVIAAALWRILSIRAGLLVAARLTRDIREESRLVWRALISTGGVSFALAATLAVEFFGWGNRVQMFVLALAAINQLPGPIVFRRALEQARELRRQGGLVVVSNREPWVHERDSSGLVVARPSPGGVSVALDALMRERGGVWVAHGAGSADQEVTDERNSVEVPPDAPAYRLRRLFLTPGQVERYYSGFSNSALWPLCHQAHVRPVFRPEDWDGYREVNRLFADAAASEASPESSVFLNDYHMALAAKYLHATRPLLKTALFWHIPWPDLDRLRICPWRQEILEGLLSNDLLAFQLPRDQRNFLAAAASELGASVSGDIVYTGDRPTRVLAIPIGADFDRITSILAEDSLRHEMERLRAELGLDGHVVGIGVDRLDYTKGIPERLAAISRVLEARPDLVGAFRFVQVGVPSRGEVHGYSEISSEIEQLVTTVNARFGGGPGGGPIKYVKQALEMPQLVALYRLADFCIVSSLHDGMNLVAKEFVAARDDFEGVLILSELAGAAEELTEALIINPYDERGFSAAIARAIQMPAWERRRRMQALRRSVAGRDVLVWASDILDRLERRKGTGFLSG